jgi:Rps23 Pro-64 3,4-dihydroxylase Tpa1-like proline 4-hydroxylase
MSRLPRHVVIDDFLPTELHDALLAHTLAQEEAFKRSSMRKEGVAFAGEGRKSWVSDAELGELKAPLEAAIRAALPAIFEGLRIDPFEPARIELEVSAHRDGDYYRPHVDTFYSKDRTGLETDRVVTAVYYLHAQPRAFSGGEFRIHPFGGNDEPVMIEPKDNRLLAIPAFALHEVLPISSQNGDFRSSRFAINAWVHRARPGAQ